MSAAGAAGPPTSLHIRRLYSMCVPYAKFGQVRLRRAASEPCPGEEGSKCVRNRKKNDGTFRQLLLDAVLPAGLIVRQPSQAARRLYLGPLDSNCKLGLQTVHRTIFWGGIIGVGMVTSFHKA